MCTFILWLFVFSEFGLLICGFTSLENVLAYEYVICVRIGIYSPNNWAPFCRYDHKFRLQTIHQLEFTTHISWVHQS